MHIRYTVYSLTKEQLKKETVGKISYRLHAEHIKKVKGYSGQEVKDEPTADVLDGDQSRLVHHLAALVDVGRPEVEHNIWSQQTTGRISFYL